MKKYKYCLTAFLTLLVLFVCPLRAQAAWTPQPLPASGVDTVFGDSRYLDPAWMSKKVTISYRGHTWVTGMDAFRDMPVRLTNANGAIHCTFLKKDVFEAYFSAINAELSTLTAQEATPLFDNGAGTYIRQSGQLHYEAVSTMPDWLAQMLCNLILTGSCSDISQELTDALLTPVQDAGTVTTSADFVLAGSCTTSFKTSNANRSSNIRLGASRLNNLVILPGQTVSVSDVLLPRTRANGYKEAGVYMNGVHTTGLGGGVCQISSTVYNAVKNAGLTVVERKAHSMPVSYLPKGLDAAIAAGVKDLRFRNDYSAPVVMYTDTSDKQLTVNVVVWNQDLAGRSFKLWAKQTGSLSADTYFTTYQDGREVSTVFVGTSRYLPYREAGDED
ncbi:MAG: VanW family protein [Eubacteriales bacterium]|nr:VanW family protein [Eubacteriales bacterium]